MEMYVAAAVSVEAFEKGLPTVGDHIRDELKRSGCVVEDAGRDVTRWEIAFVPAHYNEELQEEVEDAFHITAIADNPNVDDRGYDRSDADIAEFYEERGL